jgi:glycosyltransferase involved in cell wall biosynthesis
VEFSMALAMKTGAAAGTMANIRPLLIYALHSGNLYGTERMALATAQGLAKEFDCAMMAPEGPALAEARRLGFTAIPFAGAQQFAWELWKLLGVKRRIAFFATGVMHSSVCLLLNLARRREISHLHLVHGGAEESLSYGQKRKLNGRPVRFVAVSGFVRDRLIANGVVERQISVVENFLTDERVASAPHRSAFDHSGVPRLIVISRLDPEKKVDTLLDALERFPALRQFTVRVLGRGWNEDQLRERAMRANLPVEFRGFEPNVAAQLAASDLLVHLCPEEPFGLAILEAMAARIPVLAPDSGGAGSLVESGVSGFHFRAGDAADLAARIIEIDRRGPQEMNRIVEAAARTLATRFSQRERLAGYRALIEECYV